MHAYLVTGGSSETRLKLIEDKLKKWRVDPVDCVILTPQGLSIGISAVREFIKRLGLRPYRSAATIGIIRNGNLLTPEAQQALLKTLEEPPGEASIILETDNGGTLLPTVVSRCQLIDLGPPKLAGEKDLPECLRILADLIKRKPGERLRLLETVARSRQEAETWLEVVLSAGREILLAYYQLETLELPRNLKDLGIARTLRFLRLLLTARQKLAANVGPRLVLDNVFLAW